MKHILEICGVLATGAFLAISQSPLKTSFVTGVIVGIWIICWVWYYKLWSDEKKAKSLQDK